MQVVMENMGKITRDMTLKFVNWPWKNLEKALDFIVMKVGTMLEMQIWVFSMMFIKKAKNLSRCYQFHISEKV